jgi:histidine triad (HIT) family protein
MCVFCDIISGATKAEVVLDDETVMAFLDTRPLFPGHTLLVPKEHHETLADLPPNLIEPLFGAARLLSQAVPEAMGAVGTFVAMNNKVSQSVPHLHVHVAPRTPKDGLKGFFWPRTKYADDAHLAATGETIRRAVENHR